MKTNLLPNAAENPLSLGMRINRADGIYVVGFNPPYKRSGIMVGGRVLIETPLPGDASQNRKNERNIFHLLGSLDGRGFGRSIFLFNDAEQLTAAQEAFAGYFPLSESAAFLVACGGHIMNAAWQGGAPVEQYHIGVTPLVYERLRDAASSDAILVLGYNAKQAEESLKAIATSNGNYQIQIVSYPEFSLR